MAYVPHSDVLGTGVPIAARGGGPHLSSSAPQSGAADDRWASRAEEGPGLQERLGGRPVRAYGDVPREPEPRAMGESPREAGVLPGPPRRAAGARGAGAQGPRLIAAFLRDTSADAGLASGRRFRAPGRRPFSIHPTS